MLYQRRNINIQEICATPVTQPNTQRQAMSADAHDPVGLYFGTTSGKLRLSRDEGRKWSCMAKHLPEIYAVDVAEL